MMSYLGLLIIVVFVTGVVVEAIDLLIAESRCRMTYTQAWWAYFIGIVESRRFPPDMKHAYRVALLARRLIQLQPFTSMYGDSQLYAQREVAETQVANLRTEAINYALVVQGFPSKMKAVLRFRAACQKARQDLERELAEPSSRELDSGE